MRKINSKFTIAALGLGLMAGGILAQDLEITPESSLSGTLDRKAEGFEVEYSFADLTGLSGGQFRLKYNPELLAVEDLSNCLGNLPESHQGSFSVCNDIKEKGFVQFVVLDFGRNSEVGAGALGSVKFKIKAGANIQSVADAVSVQDVRLAGPDGRHLKPVGESAKDVRIQLK